MKIVEPSATLLAYTPNPEKLIELAGRVCYKSEDRISEDSHIKFIQMIMHFSNAHESVLEHASATFHILTDRGISHELVRHRIASYSQESTRYCNYSKNKFENNLTFIKPVQLVDCDDWENACAISEHTYLDMLDMGISPQNARSVLPTCLKTEIVMTANFREWLHFLKLRLANSAHPDMRVIAKLIWKALVEIAPTVFLGCDPDYKD